MEQSATEKVIELARRQGVIRPKDLEPHGVARSYLQRLCEREVLVRTGRGLYVLADAELSEHHSLVEAAKRVPHGVVCLLSALRFHDIGTQAPFEVWLAVERGAGAPRTKRPPLRVLRFSGNAFSEGVEEHTIEGVSVKIYGPAKTVADCFKYRNKIGVDVALEALKGSLRDRKATVDELWKFAKICRVANVMRPYMEAVA